MGAPGSAARVAIDGAIRRADRHCTRAATGDGLRTVPACIRAFEDLALGSWRRILSP